MRHINAYSNADGIEMQTGALKINLRSRLDKSTESILADLDERTAQLSARLVAPPAEAKDKIALTLEYRQRLRQRDPLDVFGIFLEACRTRDDVTIEAIVSCPRWDLLVDDATLAKGKDIRAQVEFPDVIEALKATQAIRISLQQAINRTAAYCGIRIDEIATVASGVESYY